MSEEHDHDHEPRIHTIPIEDLLHQQCDESCPTPGKAVSMFIGEEMPLGCPIHDTEVIAQAVATSLVLIGKSTGQFVATIGMLTGDLLDDTVEHIRRLNQQQIDEGGHDVFAHDMGMELIEVTAEYLRKLEDLNFRHSTEKLMRGLGQPPEFIEGDVAGA